MFRNDTEEWYAALWWIGCCGNNAGVSRILGSYSCSLLRLMQEHDAWHLSNFSIGISRAETPNVSIWKRRSWVYQYASFWKCVSWTQQQQLRWHPYRENISKIIRKQFDIPKRFRIAVCIKRLKPSGGTCEARVAGDARAQIECSFD